RSLRQGGGDDSKTAERAGNGLRRQPAALRPSRTQTRASSGGGLDQPARNRSGKGRTRSDFTTVKYYARLSQIIDNFRRPKAHSTEIHFGGPNSALWGDGVRGLRGQPQGVPVQMHPVVAVLVSGLLGGFAGETLQGGALTGAG